MLKKFKNMSIKGKVVTGFSLVNAVFSIVLILVIAVLSMTCRKYEEAYTAYSTVASKTAYSLSAYESLNGKLEKAIMISENGGDMTAALGDCMTSAATMQETFLSIGELITNDTIAKKYTAATEAYEAEAAAFQNIYKSIKTGDIAGAKALLLGNDFVTKDEAVQAAFSDLHITSNELGEDRLASMMNNKKTTIGMVVVVLVITIAVVVLITIVITKNLRIPAQHMRAAADLLAVGDVNAEITHFYDDELGDLADSLKKMQENIKAQAGVAKEISEGNLNIEFTPDGETDLLGNAIQTMLSEENRVMGGISEAVSEIKTGASEVASASQSLAQGSTEQASAIQQITASITDITERTKVNADDANTANDLVSKAKSDASESNEKMHEMINAMADINTSSENISKIIKVIDDIAFQTNILALNAAVEAARAGQHGRGFAVVAEEVRNLAGKSAQAASETAEMIEDSIRKVQKGSKLAEETAEALDTIVEVIDRIVTITNSIAVASNDQATAISQIDQAIGQVSQVVQTNSATSEQCAAASEELSAQAAKLREMISRYKLKAVEREAVRPEIRLVEPVGLPKDTPEEEEPEPVIKLDEGFGKY